eukprot:c3012_g1_i1.p1 GENE.c3012_g1_i1~~c3012_g1_i1.p1  ORF type:complete len:562 (+),score=125.26 c3012_g1_i1:48-1733(+)
MGIEEKGRVLTRKEQLRHAAQILSARGLFHAAKWASQLLVSIKANSEFDQLASESDFVGTELNDPPLIEDEQDTFSLAQSYFSTHEYLRCAHALEHFKNPKCVFLRLYALFLAGEKRKQEETQETVPKDEKGQGLLTSHSAVNHQLEKIERTIRDSPEAFNDCLCLYLLGIVLREQERHTEAVETYCISIRKFPWNWSAWSDLAVSWAAATVKGDKCKLDVSDHWMRKMFDAVVLLDKQEVDKAFALNLELHQQIPDSNYILAQLAISSQHKGDVNEARQRFEQLVHRDPFSLDHLDVFSNMLYVQGDRARLSNLAHHVVTVDKFRPETCCVVGNLYSIKQNHPRAVLYFARALRLDRRWLSAWTLMGHEYLEMRNSAAAIQAYRRAIDINPSDFRAWYGLGQTYEILQMYNYALFYYQKVTTLRPYDSRFWVALGSCYEHLHRLPDAIDCLERADNNGDDEGVALVKLAELYNRAGDQERAARSHRRIVEQHQGNPHKAQRVGDSLLYLAELMRQQGNLTNAHDMCDMIVGLDGAGPARDKARALLRDLQSQMASRTARQ